MTAATGRATARRPAARPDLRHERALLRAGARVVVGMDEVGRGALAGPVSVGAVAVDLATRSCPPGVADSKLLTPAARERLRPALSRWGVSRAVGHASAAEIDALGILTALRLAGVRALAALDVQVDLVVLDGSHDWLTPPPRSLLDELDELEGLHAVGELDGLHGLGDVAALVPSPDPTPFAPLRVPAVRTKVKADRTCASVAAASVLAKCERDAIMVALADRHPAYAWHENKGYGAPEHLAALRSLGPSELHRRTWRLRLDEPEAAPAGDVRGPDDGVLDLGSGGPGPEVVAPWAMMDA